MIYIWIIAIVCILWYLISEAFETIKSLFVGKPNYQNLITLIIVVGALIWTLNKGI